MCFQHTLKFKCSTCSLLFYTILQSDCKHVFFLNGLFYLYTFPFYFIFLFVIFIFFFLWHFFLFPYLKSRKPTYRDSFTWLVFEYLITLLFTTFPFLTASSSLFLFPLKTLQSLYKNVVLASANLIFPFCLVFLLVFLMHMRCALRPAQGTLFPLPHVWLDFFVYTYKFTFYYRIITTHVSFLYAPTTSDCQCSPTTFNCWSPKTPDDIR